MLTGPRSTTSLGPTRSSARSSHFIEYDDGDQQHHILGEVRAAANGSAVLLQAASTCSSADSAAAAALGRLPGITGV